MERWQSITHHSLPVLFIKLAYNFGIMFHAIFINFTIVDHGVKKDFSNLNWIQANYYIICGRKKECENLLNVHNSFCLKNSSGFIDSLKNVSSPDGAILIHFDVSPFFPTEPILKILEYLGDLSWNNALSYVCNKIFSDWNQF